MNLAVMYLAGCFAGLAGAFMGFGSRTSNFNSLIAGACGGVSILLLALASVMKGGA